MKKIYTSLLTVLAVVQISTTTGQTSNHTHNEDSLIAVKLNSFQHVFDIDSIYGFNEMAARQQISLSGAPAWEQKIQLSIAKRKYIKFKYNTYSTLGAPAAAPGNPSVQAPCTNVDFETGNATGWTVTEGINANSLTQAGCCPNASTRFNVVAPAVDPTIPGLQTVPPGGGNFSLKIGDGNTTGGSAVKVTQSFNVTAASSVFIYKFAVVLEDAGHNCVDQPYFNISFTDCNGNPIPCGAYNVVNSSASCLSGDPTFVASGAYKWKDWTTRSFDLSGYIGQCVTIEFIASDCAQGGHAGWAYVDCSCQPMTLSLNGAAIAVGSTNNFICAAGTNTLCAPPGFTSYTWSGQGVNGMSGQCVNVSASGNYSVTLGMAGASCSSPVLYSNFSILTPPIADFTYTTVSCQTTFSVPFQSTSSPNGGPAITSYTWSWGDNLPDGTNAAETHTYAASGTKTVKLKISNGCLDSITKSIVVSPKPVANFNVANNCLNAVSNFSSTSTATGGIVAQVWNWGDNSGTGSGVAPTHIYAGPNTYTVKLVVTDAGLCKDSISKPITIYPNPVTSFTTNPVCMGTAVSFTNTSTITPTAALTWAWDFDNNGTTDNATQSPTNNYAAAGSYTAELKASSPNGCKDSTTVTVRVNTLPTATFTPVNACVNANVLLNNTSSVPLPDALNSYTWTFGAGSTPVSSSNQNPPSLSYGASGTKTISLMIMANTTCTASITRTITVYATPVSNFSTTAVCQATQTAFTDLSTTGTGTVNAWNWDFTNDGSVDNTTQNPTLIYPSSGTFTTSLQVTTSQGCTNTFTLPVNIWGHTIPNFSPDNVCFGTATTFTNYTNTTTNANVGGTPTYDWAFNDGSPNSSVANTIHTYTLGTNGNATYNVTLTATSTHSCTDYIVKPVNVYSIPTASFTSNTVCLGNPTLFTDASNGNGNTVIGFMWDFSSNGSVDATGVSNPNYTFPTYGINTISYTVTTNPIPGLTCPNTNTMLTAYVDPLPVPDFTFVNKCINTQPNTFDGSVSAIAVGTNTNYAWAYGDGATGNGVTTTHPYSTPASYNVTLTVTSNKGCVKAVVKAIDVYKKPIMSIANSAACDGKPMSFTANEQAGSGTVTDWYWDFNNNISTIESTGSSTTSFIYPTAGGQSIGLITISNPGQCRDTLRVPVYVDYVPKALFATPKPNGCPIHCVTFGSSTPAVTLPAQINSWKWVFGDGTVVNSITGDSVTNCYNNTTSNQLKYYDVKLIVTTDKGCSDSLQKTSFVTIYPTPIASYVINPDPGNVVTPLEYFTNQSQDYTKFYWTFETSQYKSDSTHVNPTHLYISDNANTYNTNLIVVNQYGCSDTAYVAIDINPEFAFYIPNAFTPYNTDGINDQFTGAGIGIEKYDMWVYDRWGEMIFYTNDIAKGWDGKRTGKAESVKQDVFVWKVKIKDVLGKNHDYIGHVTLLR
ncbi:MAG: PKD domain-containing protein [Bacteroidota bacterium]